MNARELGEVVSRMKVGDCISQGLPGNLVEIHAVPSGWIYVFKDQMVTSGGTQLQLASQFVPDNRTEANYNSLHIT